MNTYRDAELDGLADERGWDPDLRELAQYLRATPHPYEHVEPTPQFRQSLQRRLMREAWEQTTRPAPPWYTRILKPQPMAAAAAAIGAVLIVFTAFFFAAGPHPSDQVRVQVVSPQQDARSVPTQQAIELRFTQPMDTRSVKVDILPATSYSTDWSGNTMTITPDHGLSANTQYQVKVTAARTASQRPVADIKPVVFSTGPAPTPTPSVGPSPTPPPSPVLNARQLAPIGSLPAIWVGDGSGVVVIGPSGSLQLVPLAAGGPTHLADGVGLAAVAADGSVAWLSGGQVTWKSTVVSGGVQPLGLGFSKGSLLLVTAGEVESADGHRLAALKDTATAVDLSATGDRLAYLGSQGLHLLDLNTGRDVVVGPATGLGGWSPDDHHYAYLTDAGVSTADATSGSGSPLVSLPGVNGVSWSPGNQLLMSTSSGLYLATYTDGSPVQAHLQQTGTFGQPAWAPTGSGQFTFRRNGELWIASLRGASPSTIPQATPGMTQDQVVDAFMTARKNQQTDQALGFLDSAGRAGFASYALVYSDPSVVLARSYVLLSQPGRVVVRLVVTRGATQTAIDETLGLQTDSTGRLLIHSVSEAPRQLFATGPEVLGVTVSATQVTVTFDSDLDANSVAQPGAVAIRGVATQAAFDASKRTVTLTVPSGLTSGTTYDLVLSAALQDVNQRHAFPYDLQFTGP